MIRGRYQLIFDERQGGREQLYDIVADPLAQTDLAGRQPGLVAELREIAVPVMRANQAGPGRTPDGELELDDETREQLEALGYGD